MVQRADGVREGVHVSGQLPVDGVAAVVRGEAHLLPRLDVLRVLQDPGQVFQHHAHAFPALADILAFGPDVRQQALQPVAQRVDAAPNGHVGRRVDHQLAVEDHVLYVQPDDHRRMLHAAGVFDDCADRVFRAGAGGGRDRDDGQRPAPHEVELLQVPADGAPGIPGACRDHLAGVHHGAPAEGHDAVRSGFQGGLPTGLDDPDGRF